MSFLLSFSLSKTLIFFFLCLAKFSLFHTYNTYRSSIISAATTHTHFSPLSTIDEVFSCMPFFIILSKFIIIKGNSDESLPFGYRVRHFLGMTPCCMVASQFGICIFQDLVVSRCKPHSSCLYLSLQHRWGLIYLHFVYAAGVCVLRSFGFF